VLVVLNDRSWTADESWASISDALGYTGVPHLRAVRIAGCGHFIMLDRPAELAALIDAFAADPERARTALR
jgi:pimeloyl-ACP methyl ester carboxylesterase